MSDEEYMKIAYQQACLARDIDEVPIGAIMLKRVRLSQRLIIKKNLPMM